jgi:DNA-binding protein Fis
MKVDVEREGVKMSCEFNPENDIPLQDLLCDLERKMLGTVIDHHGGNKSHAAITLKLNRTTLVEKAKKYGFPIKKL